MLVSGGDVPETGSVASGPADVRRRWLLLAAALLIPLAAAFAIGSAVKSTSAPTAGASLAPSLSVNGQHAAVTALNNSTAVPGLKAAPKPHKAPPATSSSSASSVSSPTASTPSNTSTVNSAPQVTASPPVTSSPPVNHVSPPPPTHSTPSGGTTTGVSHGGG